MRLCRKHLEVDEGPVGSEQTYRDCSEAGMCKEGAPFGRLKHVPGDCGCIRWTSGLIQLFSPDTRDSLGIWSGPEPSVPPTVSKEQAGAEQVWVHGA